MAYRVTIVINNPLVFKGKVALVHKVPRPLRIGRTDADSVRIVNIEIPPLIDPRCRNFVQDLLVTRILIECHLLGLNFRPMLISADEYNLFRVAVVDRLLTQF